MADDRDPIRPQTKIGPKHFEDEKPRVVPEEKRRQQPSVDSVRVEPVELIPAPPEELSIFAKAVLFAYGSPTNFLFGADGKIIIPDLTAEQEIIMQRVVWEMKASTPEDSES